jgi:hypothetical protein
MQPPQSPRRNKLQVEPARGAQNLSIREPPRAAVGVAAVIEKPGIRKRAGPTGHDVVNGQSLTTASPPEAKPPISDVVVEEPADGAGLKRVPETLRKYHCVVSRVAVIVDEVASDASDGVVVCLDLARFSTPASGNSLTCPALPAVPVLLKWFDLFAGYAFPCRRR